MTDYKFTEPKTQASIRLIYLDADTIRELKEWQGIQKKVLPKCRLVLSYNGTPTSKTTLPRALEKLAGLAGVHRIRIHALRHSHASLLISMGENPLLIKERLGHEKIQTTLGTYGHLYPNTNVEVAKKLTGILHYEAATESITDYTSNQHTAEYHRTVKNRKMQSVMQWQREKAAKLLKTKASRLSTRYSHSMVAGGLEVQSSTTRLIWRHSLVMRVEMVASTSYGMRDQSAVMASSEDTGRSTIGEP